MRRSRFNSAGEVRFTRPCRASCRKMLSDLLDGNATWGTFEGERTVACEISATGK